MKQISALLFDAAQAEQEGRATEAIALLEEAERVAPVNAQIQRRLADAYQHSGDKLAAAAALLASEALTAGDALRLYNLATSYFQYRHEAAEKWYRIALLVDPDLAIAHQNLAAVLRAKGDWQGAQLHLELAYRDQWIFQEPCVEPIARVLMLCAAGLGNVPTELLLPSTSFSLYKCMVEFAKADQISRLPEHDVVFNAIGDPDVPAAQHAMLDVILGSSAKPVINGLSPVMATRRDRLGATLFGIPDIVVPEVWRIEVGFDGLSTYDRMPSEVRTTLSRGVIMRSAATHGGDSVALVTNNLELQRWCAGIDATGKATALYATRFVDARADDKLFRKYRVIFIAGTPYPYHLAISSNWMVHYFSADMTAEEKLSEERGFIENPASALGDKVWATLEQIGKRLNLAYCGIDFAVMPDQKLLVFEANATMVIHAEDDGPLAYKNPAILSIAKAFERMLRDLY